MSLWFVVHLKNKNPYLLSAKYHLLKNRYTSDEIQWEKIIKTFQELFFAFSHENNSMFVVVIPTLFFSVYKERDKAARNARSTSCEKFLHRYFAAFPFYLASRPKALVQQCSELIHISYT